MKWTLLITTLPTENATVRMRAWRALKASGAAVLRDGVYLVPGTEVTIPVLEKVEQDVSEAGGTAYLLSISGDADYPFASLFDRSTEYHKLADEISACSQEMASSGSADLGRQVRKLRNAFQALCQIDFFPGETQRQVENLLTELETRVAKSLSPDEPTGMAGVVQRLNKADFNGRHWATRKRLWVDRVCSAWLIHRFIDTDARFSWLESPSDCPSDALGFDFDGATFTHIDTASGQLVTFENLMTSFGLQKNTALQRLAQIVHFLDVGGLPVAEAAGVERLLKGIRARTSDDDSLLQEASQIFDDLYLAFQQEEKTV